MSEPTGLPGEFEAISRATIDLVNAVRATDPDGIRRAMLKRGEAIDRLQNHSLDPSTLVEQKARLDREAALALQELEGLAQRIGSAIEGLGRDAAALRSYTASLPDSTVLDRSG